MRIANSLFEDSQIPSNVFLRYSGRVDEGSQVSIVGLSFGFNQELFIPEKGLQWGYELYRPGYNLVDEIDTTCLAI